MGKETGLDRFDVSGDINAISNLNFEEITDRALGRTDRESSQWAAHMIGFHPNVPYRPVLGLVALFARASSCAGNPRVPHSHPRASSGFSYVAMLRSTMEQGNFNDATNRGGFNRHFGGSVSGQGSGQGTMFGRGGFPPAMNGFHPGHAGCGPHLGANGDASVVMIGREGGCHSNTRVSVEEVVGV
jgi:hypothetical protein